MTMAKRPKTRNSKTEDSSTHLESTRQTSSVTGDHSGLSGRSALDLDQMPDTGASTVLSDTASRQTIVVTDIPVSGASAIEVTSNVISWPRHQIDQLFPIDDTGLFMSAEQKLYADTGEERLLRIEPNAKGKYQVPSRSTPDQPGPILSKIPGEPRWRIERQGLDTSANGKTVFMQPSDASAKQTLQVILPVLAEKLTKADAKGLRYDKLKRTYVDVVEEGTVLVRRNVKGEYQATTTSELVPSGPVLECIEGMTLWQRKPQQPAQLSATDDSGPGPSKRPRLGDDIEHAETEAIIDPVNVPTTTNPYLWASWGKTTKPYTVESIQIGQLYYPIVPQGPLADKLPLAFIQHPQFAPSRFEAFERMLQEAPDLQPVLTYRSGPAPRRVNGAIRNFEKPLAHYVANTFKNFTDQTSRVVAKRLFELSSDDGEINGSGLARMMQTFRHWEGKSTLSTFGIGDPLDMLPITASSDVSRRIVPLLPPESVKTLQQLNFTSSSHWKIYANDQTAMNLKTLFVNILNDSGYDTLTPDAVTHLNTLVFKRPNHPKVYFLKLGRVATDAIEIRTPLIPELDDPLLIKQMSTEIHQTLVAADARNDVVWLIGGVQHPSGRSPSIFIIRER
jgi:hypothetical protein